MVWFQELKNREIFQRFCQRQQQLFNKIFINRKFQIASSRLPLITRSTPKIKIQSNENSRIVGCGHPKKSKKIL